MRLYLMNKFKEILEQEEMTDIKLNINLEGNWVITFKYDDEEYLINIEEII